MLKRNLNKEEETVIGTSYFDFGERVTKVSTFLLPRKEDKSTSPLLSVKVYGMPMEDKSTSPLPSVKDYDIPRSPVTIYNTPKSPIPVAPHYLNMLGKQQEEHIYESIEETSEPLYVNTEQEYEKMTHIYEALS